MFAVVETWWFVLPGADAWPWGGGGGGTNAAATAATSLCVVDAVGKVS